MLIPNSKIHGGWVLVKMGSTIFLLDMVTMLLICCTILSFLCGYIYEYSTCLDLLEYSSNETEFYVGLINQVVGLDNGKIVSSYVAMVWVCFSS